MNGSSDGSFGYEYLFTDGKWTIRAAGSEQEETSSDRVDLASDVSENIFCASIQTLVQENTPSMEETTNSSFGNVDPFDTSNIEAGAAGHSTFGDSTGSVLGTFGDSTGSVLGTFGDSTGSVVGSTLGDAVPLYGPEIHSVLVDTVPVCYVSSAGCPASEKSRTVGHSAAKSSRNAVLVHHSDPESGGMLVDAVPVHHAPSKLGGISEENIHHGDSEPLENILDDAVHREVFDPAGESAGVPNDATETPRDLSGIAEADVESGSCVLEDPVADVTRDNGTENNLTVTHSLTSSVPPAPVSHGGPDAESSEETRLTYTDETSHELWVDACAFLSCEVVADAILDECGYCPVSGPPAAASDNTKPSGSFEKRGTTSGHLELPPIERWSSSDSWASALSDWIQSVSVLPEDSASKDDITSRDAPEEKITAPVGQALDESQGGKVAGLSDGPELQQVDEIRTSRTQNSPEDTSEQNEGVEGTQEATAMSGNHGTSGRPADVHSEDSGAPWEVEGDLEEGGGRNGGALSFSGYSSPAPAPPPRLNRHESDSDHLTRVDSDCRQALLVEQCLFSENSDANVPWIERPPGDSDSIMLLAPVTLGQSFLRLKEEHHESRTSLNPSLTGVGDIGEFLDTSFLTFSSRTSDQVSHSHETSCQDPRTKTQPGDASSEIRGPTSPAGGRLVICEENRVACITLDLNDVLGFRRDTNDQRRRSDVEMPHRSTKSSKNKDKASQSQNKKQENAKPEPPPSNSGGSKEGAVTLIETIIITEKVAPKSHPKKKKKHGAAKPKEAEPLLQVENGARPKNIKAKSDTDVAPAPFPVPTPNVSAKQHEETASSKPEPAKEVKTMRNQEPTGTCAPGVQDDDIVKRRRVAGERVGTVPVRARPQLPAIFRQRKEDEVVKQKVQPPKEVPRVLTEIEAAPVVDDPQNILLWCRFSSITTESTITWTKEGTVLSEEKKKMGDDGRGSFLVVKASSKDLGLYRCTLTGSHGSVSTPDYHLTSEVLMELVIPDHDAPAECRQLDGEEEDISYAPLLFKDDILTDQYFGERQHTSIVTEKDHFGEGMHRKAFRTTVSSGATPSFTPGSSCVLKVHNSISYGAKDNDELVQKNYNLAVEECYVQNTAREYIKAYTSVAKSADSFGEVPEIIPIFLVHRPSNAIPYATLEEELMGDFVKYSVRDGKEINLMRKDSEAGQKCCAFQHWVYSQTDGNLLVTDMQGVGMKLTDVGIATCKKGYKGFKGNCSTSFIDQFKALHQCNRFCEMLGLTSLQPKPRRTAPPKPKPQPGAKKKPFGPTLKGKS
ncbi:alpha-protein kinase 2 [Trichomycterus rosablanca]|uniref:alpha-protein kinase 2 n=1 Tax=Trichomycterus rosablanca TaxID=2290929 RepID=UPI002F3509D8